MEEPKKKYDGLMTQRIAVESQPLMATSNAKIKVKTENASTTPWVEEDVSTPLSTSITTELN